MDRIALKPVHGDLHLCTECTRLSFLCRKDICSFFSNFFWRASVLFVGPLMPLFLDFWWCLSSVVKSLAYMLLLLCAMDSSDSSLVWYLLTSGREALYCQSILKSTVDLNLHGKDIFLLKLYAQLSQSFTVFLSQRLWRIIDNHISQLRIFTIAYRVCTIKALDTTKPLVRISA